MEQAYESLVLSVQHSNCLKDSWSGGSNTGSKMERSDLYK